MQPCIKTMVWFVLVYHDLFFCQLFHLFFCHFGDRYEKKPSKRALSFRLSHQGLGVTVGAAVIATP